MNCQAGPSQGEACWYEGRWGSSTGGKVKLTQQTAAWPEALKGGLLENEGFAV